MLTSIPSEIVGDDVVWIMTANSDKNNTAEDFLTFEVNEDANVYVAYDKNAVSPPNWLTNDFNSTGLTIGTTESSSWGFNLYKSKNLINPGSVVLGGNKATGAVYPDGIEGNNYIVIVKKM